MLAEKYRIGVGLGDVRGVDRRQRYMGGGKGRCIIEAIPHHEHAMAGDFQRLDRSDLLRRIEPALPLHKSNPRSASDFVTSAASARRVWRTARTALRLPCVNTITDAPDSSSEGGLEAATTPQNVR